MTSAQTAKIWVHRTGVGPRSKPIGDSLLIGRGDHCDLVLDDETVSNDHLEVTRRGSTYLVADLGSSNGTLLNGRALDKPMRLNPGDVLQVGPFRLEADLPKTVRTRPRKAIAVDLTEEEREIAGALVALYREEETFAARPATKKEIAERLHISESTAQRRLRSLARKLEVHDAPRGDRARQIADRVIALGLDQR
jgi:pSer/pThr/pTyr-binding forkhead associated (FHA) protein